MRKSNTGVQQSPQRARRKKKDLRRKKTDVMFLCVFVVALICFVVSAGALIRYYARSYHAEKDVVKVAEKIDETARGTVEETDPEGSEVVIDARYQKLYQENPDFYGWIRIDDTPVDYPVMYTPKEPEYYLHTNFEKEYEYSGLPFVDARCSVNPASENLIIYGHNMKSEKMFSAVEKYKDKSFYEAHPIIHFDTIYDGSADYRIVYVIKTDWFSELYDFIDAENDEAFDQIADQMKALSLYETGYDLSREDQLITLSTCEYSVENGRVLVIAKKI